jgi:methyltransferase family protein
LTDTFNTYLAALEQRHLANLTRSELTRALRALSSCYVERREKLASGAALETAGKRAAFALYYGPLHFLTLSEIVKALGADAARITTIVDLGCGTGTAGAAWALSCKQPPSIDGVDRSAWAIQEAQWTYKQLRLRGRATRNDVLRVRMPKAGAALLLAYTVNEMEPDRRALLLGRVADAAQRGSTILVVEPIARRGRDWWTEWTDRLMPLGARTDEWRFPAVLPSLIRDLANAAGLGANELTARTLTLIAGPGDPASR